MQTKCDLIDKIKNQFYDHLKKDHSILQPIKQRQLIFKFWKENEDNSWYMVSNVDQSMRPMCRTCFQLITNAALGYYLSKLPNLNDTNQLIDQFPMIWKSCNKDCTCIVVDLPALSVARLEFVEKILVENNNDDLSDSDSIQEEEEPKDKFIYKLFYFTAFELCKKIDENGILFNKN